MNSTLMAFTSVFSFIAFYSLNRTTEIYQNASGNVLEKMIIAMDSVVPAILKNPFQLGVDSVSLTFGCIGFGLIWLIYLYNVFGSKNFMHGVEHGSAKWGTKKDIKPFIDKAEENNILLSSSEKISMNSRTGNPEYDRNKNVVVIGGSGSGKSRFFVKPNLMQLHSSYVITDPKGTLVTETGKMFKNAGYDIKTLNTINFSKSMHYNPLAYIKSEKDILKLVNVIIANTKGEGDKSGEDFWVKAEKLLYQAFIGYLYYEASIEERTIPMVLEMIGLCEVREEDEEFQNAIDVLFEDLESRDPESFAVKQYRYFKLAAGKTTKSILISCAARLAPFDIKEVKEILSYDELQLDEIGDRKTAFFVIMSDTDNTFSFLIAMMFYQMFNLLCDKADDVYGGRLPFHVRCMLDEFANIGKIPNFEKLISTIRSREISASIILQSQSQLKAIYKEDAETIIDCCDSLVFLGGKSTKTNENMSKMIGKTTIDNMNINESKGQTGSYSMNYQIIGRDLIDASEVGRLKRTECLVVITGVKPFKSMKYEIKSHPRYKELSDYDKGNSFDINQLDDGIADMFMNGITEIEEVILTIADEKEDNVGLIDELNTLI